MTLISVRLRSELVAGALLTALAGFFLLNAGRDIWDWVFPISLGIALGAIGLALLIRGVLPRDQATITVQFPVGSAESRDVLVFLAIAAIYVSTMRRAGFWTVSFLMLLSLGMLFADDRKPATWLRTTVFAFGVCAATYYLMSQVFYVPLPRSRWFTF